MEVIKAQMAKDEAAAPPVAPHAPAHGVQQPITLLAANNITNNVTNINVEMRKGPRPNVISRHSGVTAPS
jgi:hypothetical protein